MNPRRCYSGPGQKSSPRKGAGPSATTWKVSRSLRGLGASRGAGIGSLACTGSVLCTTNRADQPSLFRSPLLTRTCCIRSARSHNTLTGKSTLLQILAGKKLTRSGAKVLGEDVFFSTPKGVTYLGELTSQFSAPELLLTTLARSRNRMGRQPGRQIGPRRFALPVSELVLLPASCVDPSYL